MSSDLKIQRDYVYADTLRKNVTETVT